jgi:hypothetical protein
VALFTKSASSGKLDDQIRAPKRRSITKKAADSPERGKDYLDKAEIERFLEAAKAGRHGSRGYTLLHLMYHHALLSEVALAQTSGA